jgi:hypothetical protein
MVLYPAPSLLHIMMAQVVAPLQAPLLRNKVHSRTKELCGMEAPPLLNIWDMPARQYQSSEIHHMIADLLETVSPCQKKAMQNPQQAVLKT